MVIQANTLPNIKVIDNSFVELNIFKLKRLLAETFCSESIEFNIAIGIKGIAMNASVREIDSGINITETNVVV
ncbi:hypothetical protein P3477_13970 [Vibrio parahaemolyticus]|nr:hypothetical protein [Vibrio parahaemolyticus]